MGRAQSKRYAGIGQMLRGLNYACGFSDAVVLRSASRLIV
jgi:hypothetical protein